MAKRGIPNVSGEGDAPAAKPQESSNRLGAKRDGAGGGCSPAGSTEQDDDGWKRHWAAPPECPSSHHVPRRAPGPPEQPRVMEGTVAARARRRGVRCHLGVLRVPFSSLLPSSEGEEHERGASWLCFGAVLQNLACPIPDAAPAADGQPAPCGGGKHALPPAPKKNSDKGIGLGEKPNSPLILLVQ